MQLKPKCVMARSHDNWEEQAGIIRAGELQNQLSGKDGVEMASTYNDGLIREMGSRWVSVGGDGNGVTAGQGWICRESEFVAEKTEQVTFNRNRFVD